MKKHLIFPFLLTFTLSFFAQKPTNKIKESYIQGQQYLQPKATNPVIAYGDSLKGFDETAVLLQLKAQGVEDWEASIHLQHLRRAYVNKKYNLRKWTPSPYPAIGENNIPSKKKGGGAMVQGLPCVNEGFEQTPPGAYTTATAVTGWTVESRTADGACTYTNWAAGSPAFSIVATPLVNWPNNIQNVGIIQNSPLGGTLVAQLNDDQIQDYEMTRIRQTFPVTVNNAQFMFAYAGYWQLAAGHTCCQRPGFEVKMYDCNGDPLTCVSMSLFPGCSSSNVTFTTNPSGDNWTNWQVKTVDFTPYIGTCITVEFINTDCSLGGHFGTMLLDVLCGSQTFGDPIGGYGGFVPGASNFCAGGSTAQLNAPSGYTSYQWIAPTGSIAAPQGTQQALTITNPTVGITYTVHLKTASGCQYYSLVTLNHSTVNIGGLGTTPSCPNGASGSASVSGTGSGDGYIYTWLNSSNNVISTQSFVTGLAPGIYSVQIAGLGSASCGSAVTTATITSAPPTTVHLIKEYCANEAYLQPPQPGTGFQWYIGTSPVTTSLGILPTYTVIGPSANSVYWVSYTTNQGCQDSVKFTLYQVNPGNMTVPPTSVKTICAGASNGTAAININPAGSSPGNSNTYYVVNSNTATPTYSVVHGPTSSTSMTLTGLSPGSYSVQTFDGLCKYTTTFNVNPLTFDFTVTPLQTTLCPGGFATAGVNFNASPAPGQYAYSWSPTTWLFSGNGNVQNTLITPTVANGAIVTTVYTVVVTPTLAPCAVTKTIAVTAVNPPTPTITPVTPLCNNFSPYQVIVSPGGGTFTAQQANIITGNSGIITPSNAAIGVNTFSYSVSVHTCVASSTSTFEVSQFNSAALTASLSPLCVTNAPVNLMNIVQQTGGNWLPGQGIQGNSFNPAALNTGVYNLTYSINSTPNPLACPQHTSLQVSVTKTMTPIISSVKPFCTNATPITMTALPSGGTWSGPNISVAGVINPATILQPGQYTAGYSVTTGPCINTATIAYNVSKFVPATLTGSIGELCVTSPAVNLMSIVQNTLNGSWHSDCFSLQNGMLQPSELLTNQPCKVIYKTASFPDASLCPDSRTLAIHVLNPQTPNITPVDPLCNKGEPVKLSVSPANGKWVPSAYLNSNGVFTPSLAATGNNPVQYVIGTPTCFAQHTRFVSVEAFVSAATTLKKIPDLCNNGAPINLSPFVYNNGGTWSGPGITGTSFDPAIAGKGEFEITYHTASYPSGLCPDESKLAVSVFSLQTPRIKEIGPFCDVMEPVKLTADVQGGMFGGANNEAVNSQGLFIPARAVKGPNIITYSVSSGPCIAYAQTTITVEKFVSADFHTTPPSFCPSDSPVNMDHFVVNPGGYWSGNGINGKMFVPSSAIPGNHNIITYHTHSLPTASLCPDKKEIRLEVVKMPELTPSASMLQACAPAEIIFNLPNVNQGKAFWRFGDGKKAEGLLSNHTFEAPGTYSVQVTYELKGCRNIYELSNSFTVHPQPQANFEIPPEASVSDPELLAHNTTSNLEQHVFSWKLNGKEDLKNYRKVHASYTFSEPGKYSITMLAENIHGCKSEVTKFIDVKNSLLIYIPEAFSPNGDGLNDHFVPVFSPYGLDQATFEMEVFDRWGHLLHKTTDALNGWDGTVGSKKEVVKEGVYVYMIRFKDFDGNNYRKTGHVTLLK